jgi:hypothetical protein
MLFYIFYFIQLFFNFFLVFIHRKLLPNGRPVGPPNLNILPSDSLPYEEDRDDFFSDGMSQSNQSTMAANQRSSYSNGQEKKGPKYHEFDTDASEKDNSNDDEDDDDEDDDGDGDGDDDADDENDEPEQEDEEYESSEDEGDVEDVEDDTSSEENKQRTPNNTASSTSFHSNTRKVNMQDFENFVKESISRTEASLASSNKIPDVRSPSSTLSPRRVFPSPTVATPPVTTGSSNVKKSPALSVSKVSPGTFSSTSPQQRLSENKETNVSSSPMVLNSPSLKLFDG